MFGGASCARRARRRSARPPPAAGKVEHAALKVPQTAIRIGGSGPRARRPGLHPRLCGQRDPRRRHILLAPLQVRCARSAGSPIRSGRGSFPTIMPAPSSQRPPSTRRTRETAIKIMLDEIKRFATEGPTEAELAATKDYLVGNFALRFDSSQKIARNLLQFPARRPRHRLHREAQRPDPRRHCGGYPARRAAAVERQPFGGHRRPRRDVTERRAGRSLSNSRTGK